MKIRRIQYQINFTHIITFAQEYKPIIAKLFAIDGMQYAIDRPGTIDETARLIFPNDNVLIQLSKESLILAYEGNVDQLNTSHPFVEVFYGLYEDVKGFIGYTRTANHTLRSYAVAILGSTDETDELEMVNTNVDQLVCLNPFGGLNEFACTYNFDKPLGNCNVVVGNYNEKDIAKFDLSPFKAQENADLFGNNIGMMAETTIVGTESAPNRSKFLGLIKLNKELLAEFPYSS